MRRLRPGLQSVFLLACLLGYTACIIVSVERFVFERYHTGVSLAIDQLDFEDFLRREGRSREEGYHLLLQTGVDILYLRARSVDELVAAGEISRLRPADLLQFKRLADGFPELLIRLDPLLTGGEVGGEWLLGEAGGVLARLRELLPRIPGLTVTGFPATDNGVDRLHLQGAGSSIFAAPLVFEDAQYELLARMGFRLYYDLTRGLAPGEAGRAELLRRIRRGRFAGLRLDEQTFRTEQAASLLPLLVPMQDAEAGAFRGTLVLAAAADGHASGPRILPRPLRTFAGGMIEESRADGSMRNQPAAARRVWHLPLTGMGFAGFRQQCEDTVARIRQQGLHLRTAQGIDRSSRIWPLAAQCLLLLGLFCLYLAVRRRIKHLVLLVLFLLAGGLLLLLLPWLMASGWETELRMFLFLPWLFLMAYLPLVMDRSLRLTSPGGLERPAEAAFHLLLTFLFALLAAPVFLALQYDPVLLNLTCLQRFKAGWLFILVISVLIFPLLNPSLRRRLWQRVLESPLHAGDLVRLVGVLLLFLVVFRAAMLRDSQLAGSWLSVPEIWLIGAPAFWFHQQARLRRRTREVWLLSPLAVLLPGGLVWELWRVPALPITWRLSFLLQCALAGLLVTAACWRLQKSMPVLASGQSAKEERHD